MKNIGNVVSSALGNPDDLARQYQNPLTQQIQQAPIRKVMPSSSKQENIDKIKQAYQNEPETEEPQDDEIEDEESEEIEEEKSDEEKEFERKEAIRQARIARIRKLQEEGRWGKKKKPEEQIKPAPRPAIEEDAPDEEIEQSEDIAEQQSDKQAKEPQLSEIIGIDIDEKLGIIYKVRSNNPNYHLGMCGIIQ